MKIKTLAPIGIGMAIGMITLITMVNNKAEPNVSELSNHATKVETIALAPQNFTAQAQGFGTLSHTESLTVSSEVAAKVIWLHPELKKGNKLAAGTEVLRLDQQDLLINLDKAKADQARLNASLSQLKLEQQVAQSTYQTSQQSFKLAKNEFNRKQQLAKQGNLSASVVEAEQQKLNNSEMDLANKATQLEVYPLRLASLEQDLAKASLAIADINNKLEKTSIRLQKDRRIGDVLVEQGSFVGIGAPLVKVHNPDTMELVAYFHPSTLARFGNWQDEFTKLSAKITLGEQVFSAQLSRIEDQLANNRMVAVVANLSDSNLIAGSYAQLDLTLALANQWVVPRSNIHNQQLYLAEEDQLVIEPVDVRFYQGDFAVLSNTPTSQRLISSAVFPAISGMAIEVINTGSAL